MATAMASVSDSKSFYFAYSVDLSTSMMKRRYHGTDFVGVAKLPGFKWLVGSRGQPVIAPSAQDVVYGMLYAVPVEHFPDLEYRAFKRAAITPTTVTVSLHVDTSRTPANPGWGFAYMGPSVGGERTARVLVAEEGEVEGVIPRDGTGERLLTRLNRGIVEAKMEGFPDDWTSEVLRRWIPYPTSPDGVYW